MASDGGTQHKMTQDSAARAMTVEDRAALVDRLRYWTEAGLTHLARPEAEPTTADRVPPAAPASQDTSPRPPSPTPAASVPIQPAVQPAAPVPRPGTTPVPTASPARSATPVVPPVAPATTPIIVPASGNPLSQLADSLIGCTRCTLAPGRTHIVFGVGDPNADVVFVGEAPGRDEDLKGEPFVGKAGKLLTDIIEKGMGVPRASVYICNTVKCRPPENRNPKPDELAACEPFLVQQLNIIRPKVIVAMGKFAAQAICKSEVPISRLRGNWHKYEDVDVMPTFHPAYLLRSPSAKRDVWADIQAVMAKVGLKKSP